MAATITKITPEELKRDMDLGRDTVVLDARSQTAYDSSPVKIKGAIRIPPEEIADRYRELPKDKLLVTY